MGFLMRMAIMAAAGVAGWALFRRKDKPAGAGDGQPQVVYLSDEDAVIDGAREPSTAPAEVLHCVHRMNPLTLHATIEACFILADGTELTFELHGEGRQHLAAGDQGQLTWRDDQLISFEKDNGEVIGGMYYVPAQAEGETHE